ncbi:hypothetical protein N3K63_08410 [Microbacterium sp. W1N]|uniref:hypothetical protein n=1 Tax=Microbacterium festucae TaxID=2977531 RepID=UPI0021C0655A|nr:hypothetical protein [Microbacterium festucae]MCT9820303.1 hypothetical protein [Microbacterium festucae]
MSRRRLASCLLALTTLAGSMALAGCAPEPAPVGPRLTATPEVPRPGATDADDASTDAAGPGVVPGCIDGVVRIGASSQVFAVTADCPRLEVSGADVEVAAAGVEIGEVIVRGDGNTVEVADPSQVIIEGQRNTVDAVSIGTLEVRGNANQAIVDQALSFVTVNGNTNSIQAGQVGSVTDNGDGNIIGSR